MRFLSIFWWSGLILFFGCTQDSGGGGCVYHSDCQNGICVEGQCVGAGAVGNDSPDNMSNNGGSPAQSPENSEGSSSNRDDDQQNNGSNAGNGDQEIGQNDEQRTVDDSNHGGGQTASEDDNAAGSLGLGAKMGRAETKTRVLKRGPMDKMEMTRLQWLVVRL